MNLKSKTITAIVIAIILVGLAVLIWANQTGKIKIFGAVERSQVTKTIQSIGDWAKGAFSGSYLKDGKLMISSELQGSEVFTDSNIGFSVTKPNSWDDIRYSNGIVIVPEDGGEVLTGVFIYPIKLRQEMSLEAIANKYFRDGLAGQYYNPQLSGGRIENGIYTADINALAPEQPLTGKLTISLGYDGRDNTALMKFWWAPSNQYNNKKNTLEAVAQSYQTKPPVANQTPQLVSHRINNFDAWYPQDWKLDDQIPVPSQNGINGLDLVNNNSEAGVALGVFAGGLLGSVAPFSSAEEVITKVLKDGYDLLGTHQTALFTNYQQNPSEFISLGSTPGPGSTNWTIKSAEFTGKPIQGSLKDKAVRCVATAAHGKNQNVSTFGFLLTIRCALENKWRDYDVITQVIQEQLKIKEGATIAGANANGARIMLPRNNPADSSTYMGSWAYRNQVQSAASDSWQETIMGYENASDGTNSYQMPLNSWQQTDPSGGNGGPGYYIWKPTGWAHLEQTH